MKYEIKKAGEYTYLEEGNGEVLMMLHGLFGALSNWEHVIEHFKSKYKVIIPLLPIYEMPLSSASIDGLVDFVEGFVDLKSLEKFNLMGNSLGGHISLVYTLRHPEKVKTLILTGSSGLFENSMGGSFPKRGSYEYIKERVAYTFYYPETATDELVKEVFETTKSIPKCLRIVAIAKSAQRHNMAQEITKITAPTLLVWGLNDTITPAGVGHEFNRLIPNSELWFIDKCCHAPMMENPKRFNSVLESFLQRQNQATHDRF
jgi:pimeloyl-ACP methyl ester carboxylesterase